MWGSAFWGDLRFAWRGLRKQAGFSVIAVVTLGLGIGACTAVFGLVEGVILRPLPYREPGRLTAVWITSTRESGLAKIFANYADYAEFRRTSRSFESLGAATWATNIGRVMTGVGPARNVLTVPGTVSFFETLGVPAAIGRTFRAEDEGSGCSLLLAHGFWKSGLGTRESIVGQSLTLDDKTCRVVGVMPESFSFYPRATQAWMLLGRDYQNRQDQLLVGIFARLKPGVTLAQAEGELRGLYRGLHPGKQSRDFQPVVYDLHGEFTFLAGRTLRTTLLLVFAAVMLVLLIACLNVGNLLLARLSERRRELAVRAALGSGQGRLIRQVLTEGLLLAGVGAGLGVAMAWAALRGFRAADPIELSVGANVAMNWPVLGFSIALAFVTTLVFALVPAVRASRVDLTVDLKAGGRGFVQGRQRLTRAVVSVEVALSFVMLIAAGLLMTSALRMGSENLGFRPAGILAGRIKLPATHFATAADRVRAYDQLTSGLARVGRVALGSRVPPEAGGNEVLEVQGRTSAEMHEVGVDAVSPEYFEVLEIPLLRGRALGPQDRQGSTAVAVINEALAARYFPGSDPVGQEIRIAGTGMSWLTVVGVVGNVKHTELMNEMSWLETPMLYRPLAQDPRQTVEVAVRAARPAAGEIEKQIGALMRPFQSANWRVSVRG